MYLLHGERLQGVRFSAPMSESNDDPSSDSGQANDFTLPVLDQARNETQDFSRLAGAQPCYLASVGEVGVRSHLILNEPSTDSGLGERRLLSQEDGGKQTLGDLSCLILRSSNLSQVDRVWYSHIPAITVLILSDNKIECIPEDMPCCMPGLRRLSIDRNKLRSLPESIGLWDQMRHLILGTEAGGNPLGILPRAIGKMKALVSLEAAHCQLTYLEKDALGPSLEQLDLSHNQLQGLSGDPFTHCTRLKILNLKNNGIHTLCQDFVNRMGSLFEQGLDTLNLEQNRIPVLPWDFSIKFIENIWVDGNPLVKARVGSEEEQEALRAHYQAIVQSLLLKPIPNIDTASLTTSTDWLAQQVDPYSTENDRVDTFLKACLSNLDGTQIPSFDSLDCPVRSLREIAFRTIPSTSEPPPRLPLHLKAALRLKKDCIVCQGPYLSEWINALQWKYSRGHLFLCKAKICSNTCYQTYIHSIHQKSFRLTNENLRERARRFIQQSDHADSMTWIVAATVAESEAIVRIELTANGY
ncbi:hypothetical protein BY458DRAFT_515161 [Sporodiniella umbellata]|nr:hypothetical protein BY458DRAFT_515161 [Sporodiniella umbellata]